MKTFTASITALLALAATPALADFYLYAGVVSTPEGVEDPETHATPASDRGDCDGIDNSPETGAAGDVPGYPWPEDEFESNDPVCDIALRFVNDGGDLKVYDSATDEEVGTCTKSDNEDVKFCNYGLLSAEYEEVYFCESSVCA